MKRFISVLLVLIMMVTMLSGCKKESGRPFDYDLSKYITLGDYVGIEYTYEVAEVTEEAVAAYIKKALSEKGYGEEVDITDRAVVNGDTVNIDFVGKIDGKEFEGGSTSEGGYDLEIGSKTFIDGFEEGVIGMKIGETKDLNLKFPNDYGKDELNGKDVVFTVTLNTISAVVYPELTDDIVKELSEDHKTVDDYKKYANEQVLASNEQAATDKKEAGIWSKVVENVTVKELPEKEIKNYKELLLESYEQAAQSQYNMSYEQLVKQVYGKTMEDIDPEITEQAKSAVKEYMTIVAIARDQDLDITEEEFRAEADKYAASNGYSTTEEFLEAIDEGQFYLSLLINVVMDFVVENAVEAK